MCVESGRCTFCDRYDDVFMLMQIPNTTSETYRKCQADYFSATIAISRVSVGVDGMFVGDSLFSDSTLANSGTGLSKEQPAVLDAGISVQNQAGSKSAKLSETKMLNMLDMTLLGKSGESKVFKTP